MDTNSTFNSTFNFYYCFKKTHVGMVVAAVVASLRFFLGTPAHSWLLWLFVRDGWKIKPTQVFFVNHTVLELICCIQCAADMLTMLIFKRETFLRKLYIVFAITWVGRPLLQTCICVEQYLAVIHPIIFLNYKDKQYRMVSAAVVWLVGTAYAVLWVFANIYSGPIFYIVFFTAVTVISFCCVSVLRALKHPGPGDTQITTQRGRDVGNQQKRNAFKTILSALLIILITYLPEVSLPIFTVIKMNEEFFYCEILPFITSLNYLGVIITPLLKIYNNGHLKCLNHQR